MIDKIGAKVRYSRIKLEDRNTDYKAQCTVISTIAAQKLYENSGFVLECDTTLQVPGKFATRPTVRILHMVRERTISR
jgi:hypothetical protein